MFENWLLKAILLGALGFAGTANGSLFGVRLEYSGGKFQWLVGWHGDTDWVQMAVGIVLLGLFFYLTVRLKIKPTEKEALNISNVVELLQKPFSTLVNFEIQDKFGKLFGVKPPIPEIRFLLASDDPYWRIVDYKAARRVVDFQSGAYFLSKAGTDLGLRKRISGICYFISAALVFISITAPSWSNTFPGVRQDIKFAAVLGFIIGLTGFWLSSRQISETWAAERLIALPAGSPPGRDADIKTAMKLMSTINTGVFDEFLVRGRELVFDGRILHFWLGFNAGMTASKLHFHDTELAGAMHSLHAAWEKSVGFGAHFFPTKASDVFVLRMPQESSVMEADALPHKYSAAMDKVSAAYIDAIKLLRKKYPEIDLEITDQAAADDFRSVNSAGQP